MVYRKEWRKGRSGADLDGALRAGGPREQPRSAPLAPHGDRGEPSLMPFHLAFPTHDLAASRRFYGEVLGCAQGRSAARWVDFNLYGHQVVCHLVDGYNAAASANAVDGDPVPVPHFGVALDVPGFQRLAERLKSKGVELLIDHTETPRFEGQPGEQYTMFFKDPSGNSLEFKAMTHPENLFAKYTVSDAKPIDAKYEA